MSPKPTVDIETSVVSYLTARPSRDLLGAANQQLTRDGWMTRAEDALHVAMAAAHGLDYLLTWNCTHIANATLRGRIEGLCRSSGMEPPIICTPLELQGKPQ